MKKFVFLNPLGEPVYTATPSSDGIYVDGNQYGDHVCREIPFESDDQEVLRSWFWKRSGGWGVRPERPSNWYEWDVDKEAWVADLAALKNAKRQEINAAKLAANRSHFVFQGKKIACDEQSRSAIDSVNGVVVLTGQLPTDWVGAWKAIDNTFVPITDVETWRQFYTALAAHDQANFLYSQELKALVDRAATEEQVTAIHWGMAV